MNPTLSIVIPAYNEENYLPGTLAAIHHAAHDDRVEVIVVDNGSTDATAEVARRHGAAVTVEPRRGIGAARNTGAVHADAEWLLFIDADTPIPDNAITEVLNALAAGAVGGALRPMYRPSKRSVRALCRLWQWYAVRRNIAQGVAMFCTRKVFFALGGFNESMFMAEDSDFYHRLCRHGDQIGQPALFLDHVPVCPSLRRHEQWPAWKMIFWTNPLTTRLFLRSRWFWRGWYDTTPR
ncbi:MAG: glycosyltransferase [Micromonosporaceae bacterium]